MVEHSSDLLVIGAGMAGLACANALAQAGRSVLVLDKGRGPGGRMAARRAEIAGESVSFDHGAQYFTARDSAFRAAVAGWAEAGVVTRWPAAGENAWIGVPGMNAPIRTLAEPVDVHWGVRALAVRRKGARWLVETDKGTFAAATLIVAVPAEQARDLLEAPAPELAAVAASVHSAPCWAVMTGFAQRLPIAADAIRDPDAAIAWAARNSAKPQRSGSECWVLHASPQRSRELLDLPAEEVGARLLDDFFAQTGVAPTTPIHLAVHRWLYAMPAAIAGEPARYDADQRIGIAGDYLHSPRVEGAFLSGRALAERVLSTAPGVNHG
jgi:hypothetical protein